MRIFHLRFFLALLSVAGVLLSAGSMAAPPSFSIAFSPSTIGPASITTLTYTIDNSAEATAVTGLSFINTLPAGMTVANPSRASSTCLNGVLAASPGGSSVAVSDYRLSRGSRCEIFVDVSSADIGTHLNTTGAVASSAGSISAAAASLVVDDRRPGFGMAFSPSTISEGSVSRLTYSVDNSANIADVILLSFANTLPPGLVVADQPDALAACNAFYASQITAEVGSNSISASDGSVLAGADCSFGVNVTAAIAGEYVNASGELSQSGSNSSGSASALLTVTKPFLNLTLPASVSAGSEATLVYTLHNTDRQNAAENISFSNDLSATLSGLTATALPAAGFCGAGSTISGSSSIAVAGANLASGESCSFEVSVLIPPGAAAGTYSNTTSIVNVTLGSSSTKPAVTHSLVVVNGPLLSMEFIDDPVGLGDNLTLRFTVTNTDAAQVLSNIDFQLAYNVAYSDLTVVSLPSPNSCGAGSVFRTLLVDDLPTFQLMNGYLEAGQSCTVDLVFSITTTGVPGSYQHRSSYITGEVGGTLLTGAKATATMVVNAAPRLSFAIADEYVAPGDSIAAEFSLSYSENAAADVSDLSFTMDLDAVLSGLTFSSASTSDICGAGSAISGSSTLSFTGGSLSAGEACSVALTLHVPSSASPSTISPASSALSGTSAAQTVTYGAASDSVTISGLSFGHSFLSSPALPDETVTVRYSISNSATSPAATNIAFIHSLTEILSTFAAVALPANPCGGGSTITGTTSLQLSDGSLAPGESCTFDVSVAVPSAASSGIYNSVTSAMSATVNSANTSISGSSAELNIATLSALITSSARSPSQSSPIPVSIGFSRAVANFTVSDLSVTNGSASNFSGAGDTYSVDITPAAIGDVVITLPANSVDDAFDATVKNAEASFTIAYAVAPSLVAVTVPATAINAFGASYDIAGTHSVNGSRVYLYADDNNDGIADSASVLATALVDNNSWSFSAPLNLQASNNFIVGWDDRENRVIRYVNVPTITEVTPNYDPVIGGAPATSVDEDASYSFTPTLSDANTNDSHTFSITNLPSWASFDSATGALSGTPTNGDVGTSSNIVITVTDSAAAAASLSAFAIAVVNTNDSPQLSGAPSSAVAEDAFYSFTPTLSDVDVGDSAGFSISNPPSWADFNPATGALSGTPGNGDIGTYADIVITATDSGGASDSLPAFSIAVSNTNDAPIISGTPSAAINEDSAYSFIPAAVDVDPGDSLVFSIANRPAWASFNSATGALSGLPGNSDVGLSSAISISVTDAAGASDSLPPFSISVVNVNDAPTISGSPGTAVDEDSPYSFTPAFNDIDSGDTLAFSMTNRPAWASLNAVTGELSGTPGNADVGSYTDLVLTVTDSAGGSASLAAFAITVNNTNDAPLISGAPSNNVAEDATYSFTPTLSDVDSGDTASFSIINQPPWASFNTATGALSGTPTNSDVGLTTGIVISVSDAAGASASLAPFSISVSNTNDAIAISGSPATAVAEDSPYSFRPTVSDVDVGDSATFSVTNLPPWASFAADTGTLSGVPSNEHVGLSGNIVISVTDSGAAISSLPPFDILVTNTNDAPAISGSPATRVAEDASYRFSAIVSDVDSGDTAIFSISNRPAWANFDSATGVLSGTPTNDDVGLYSDIVISVRDSGAALAALPAFSIAVSNTNDAPQITGTPGTAVAEDASYSFTPSASDMDQDDSLVFSIANMPTWASFDSATGALTGTPDNADVGSTANIVISVTDAVGAIASLAPFDLSVLNTNDLPLISGTPASRVEEDSTYTFIPTVNEPDVGDSLSFRVSNLPRWASFNASTGALSGTPDNSHIGLSAGIVISVSDSAGGTASLPAFAIQVINTNDAPVISGAPPSSVEEDERYSFVPSVSDVDSDESLSFSVANLPAWASFDPATGALSGTPSNDDVGVYGGILISVTDSANASDSLAVFSISVRNINSAPSISGTPPSEVFEDANYRFTPSVSDEDVADIRVFSIVNQPPWLSFNPSNGALSGTPSDEDVGAVSDIVIQVADMAGASASLPPFSITVININDLPVAVDDAFVMRPSADGYLLDVLQNDTDDDGDTLSILSFHSPVGSLAVEDGQLRFEPGADIDTVEFEYAVSDGKGGEDVALVSFSLDAGNSAPAGPVIEVPDDLEVNASGLFTRVDLGVATAADARGNPLPVSLLNDTLLFASGTHKIYWQATDEDGERTVREQTLRVHPLVSFSKGQQTTEDSRIGVDVFLSGDAPAYPYTVPYRVSGTADEGDHNLSDGELVLSSQSGRIEFAVYADGIEEETETITLSLADTVNRGSRDTHSIEILSGNVAPKVSIHITQDGEARTLIDQGGGPVLISATVTDPNSEDEHSFAWQFEEGVPDLDDSDNSFSFAPADLVADHYAIALVVSDSGTPKLEVSAKAYFEVRDVLPVLNEEDSDGDLIPDELEGFADDDGDGIPNYLDAGNAGNTLPSTVLEQGKWLLESPPGTLLRKGQYSAGNEGGAALMNARDINAQLVGDSAARNVGGIFSFILSGLPDSGQSYSIVLPQQEALPRGGRYRKYLGTAWVDFSVNERNAIHSAAGEQGYCPPPNAELWQVGLREGHWCVQLTIEDGGPNDNDGLANGAIADPGGVAVSISDNRRPAVVDDRASTVVGTAIEVDVLGNDSDEDGDSLAISSATANIGSSEITDNGELLYTPPAGFVGSDRVVYSISDGNGGSASGSLVITVNEPRDAVVTTPSRSVRSGGGSIGWLAVLTLCLLCFRRHPRTGARIGTGVSATAKRTLSCAG